MGITRKSTILAFTLTTIAGLSTSLGGLIALSTKHINTKSGYIIGILNQHHDL